MAKGRMINRTIAIDPDFNRLSLRGQWLYMRMLPFIDDWGKMSGNAFEIKYLCIPSSDVEPDWIDKTLNRMKELGLIAYEKDVCVQFTGFEKNQKIGHRRAESKYPNLIDIERSGKVSKGKNNIIEDNIKESNSNKKKISSTPTLEEVISYFKERDIPSPKENALKFWSHYESGNWFRGKTKIKKWKMCLKNWDFKEVENGEKGSGIDFSKFKRNDINGVYTAYCTKCNKEENPQFPFEISRGSTCCNVEYKPNKEGSSVWN